jgi:predicted transcriptional regulator
MVPFIYTPLAVVSRARKSLRVSTTATISQIPVVSLKDGAVIGTVLSTQVNISAKCWF